MDPFDVVGCACVTLADLTSRMCRSGPCFFIIFVGLRDSVLSIGNVYGSLGSLADSVRGIYTSGWIGHSSRISVQVDWISFDHQPNCDSNEWLRKVGCKVRSVKSGVISIGQ